MPILPREGVTTRAAAVRHDEVSVGASGSGESTDHTTVAPSLNSFMAEMRNLLCAQHRELTHNQEQMRTLLTAQRDDLAHRLDEQARMFEERTQWQDGRLESLQKSIEEQRSLVERHEQQMLAITEDLNQLKADGVPVTNVSSSSSGGNFKLPPFDGNSSWAAYRLQFEAVSRINGWNEERARTALTLGLRDQALSVLEALGGNAKYEELLEALEARFGDGHLQHVFRAQLKDRTQRTSETLQQWALEVEKLVRKAYQSSSDVVVETMLLQAFVDGIRDPEVRAAVRLEHPTTLKGAVVRALEVEAVRYDPRSMHRLREVTATEDRNVRQSYSPRCYSCGERGHLRRNCQRVTSGNCRGVDVAVSTSEDQGKLEVARAVGWALAGKPTIPTERIMITQSREGNTLVIDGKINGITCQLTLDTGASRTIIKSQLLTNSERVNSSNVRLSTATGQRVPIRGEKVVALKIGEQLYWHNVIIADILDDCIVGLDFLRKFNCKLDMQTGILLCGTEGIPMKGGACGKVYCLKDTELSPRSQTLVPIRLPQNIGGKPRRCAMVDKLDTEEPWILARTIVGARQDTVVPVLNLSEKELVIKKGTPIGSCDEIIWLRSCTEADSELIKRNDSNVAGLIEDCREGLTNLEMMKARNLLLRYSDLFSTNDGDIGRTGLVQHTINTGDQLPIRQRPRRIPFARENEVEKMITDMKSHDVIESSISPWCSPVVLVKKKDGSTRFCIDYRRLNDVTKKDSYPLPRIDDTLDTLSGMKWFSTLDLKSGYWQVELNPTDKEKTAFSTGKGLWQFKVMPFGLCNAPATFERLMEQVLAGLLGETCLVYLDDIIIVGRDFEDHIRKLGNVFEKLRAARLKLSPKKCSFFKRQVNYLGHVISAKGVETDATKIDAVKEWPTPKDKTEVRAFLGLCSYYRRFVKGFSDIAKPLHRLTEDKRPFLWDTDCNSALVELKKRLCETPILGYPDTAGEFIVDTDASNTGLGGVLSQRQEGNEVVISYFSKSLSKPEKNYCVTRRELLAIVKTLQHFKKYLLGRKFLLRTDHAALIWLLNFKNPEGQVARWIEQLQEFEFDTVHRKGTSHGNADALSRRPCPSDCKHCVRQETRDPVFIKVIRTDLTNDEWNNNAMRTAQKDDNDIKPILQWFESNAPRPQWHDVAGMSVVTKCYWAQWNSLILQEGLLYRKWEAVNGKETHFQLIVPRSKVNDILREFHDGCSGGHLGVKRTLMKIKQRFYWIHAKKDVEDWCRKCTRCAAVKGPQTRSRGALRLYNVGAPWERIALDVAGPFPMTVSGNRYFLVVMDYFTKWPEVFALPNQEAVTISNKLVNEVVSRFGLPLEIHTDQGRNFESQVFQETCKILGIHKTRTTPYHPQSDGMVERFNQTLERHLAKLVDNHQRNWDEYIPLFLLSYRTAVHESTGVTPACASFGRELRLPAELLAGCPPDTPREIVEFTSELRMKMLDIHSQVREAGLRSSERMKTRYDRKATTKGYDEGSLVWLHNPVRKQGFCPKLQASWEGPYKVITKINDVTYRIQKAQGSPLKIVHVDRLALYHGSNDARDEHCLEGGSVTATGPGQGGLTV